MQKLVKVLPGITGICGSRPVFIGLEPAWLLAAHSFADTLDELSGKGYQRRFSSEHSLDFRRYITQPGSATIPLAFNLRPERKDAWELRTNGQSAELLIQGEEKVFSQVDCQHRLGSLADSDISLPFMSFIGLTVKEEMQIFNVINGKAKGLNSSLLDYHDTQLIEDVRVIKPYLYIALRLHRDSHSPWHGQLDLGGGGTTGLKRRASLRTMQKAVKRFMKCSGVRGQADDIYPVVLSFWKAAAGILKQQWSRPRNHLVTKGVGVYALMSLAGEITKEINSQLSSMPTEEMFCFELQRYLPGIDWSNRGPFRGLGGEQGANEAFQYLLSMRNKVTTS